MSDRTSESTLPRKQSTPLMYFLGFIFLVFIGILIFTYTVTKRTNPIYVDEHGKPINADSTQHDSGGGHTQ